MGTEPLSVAILTQYFYPEVPGTAQIATDLALGLAESGFDVSVFTGQPAYWRTDRLPSSEAYQGISIHRSYSGRLPRSRLSTSGHRGRLLNGAVVAAMTLFKLLPRKKPDVLLVDSTSPFLLVTAWLLNRFRRVPYVFVVQDVFPQVAVVLDIVGQRSVAETIWRWAYARVYRAAARVVVLGPRMKKVVENSLTPRDDDKCEVIPNWADGEVIVPRSRADNPVRRELGLADKLVVIYSGNMGPAHDMETVLEAAGRLLHISEIRFLLVGDGGSRDSVASVVKERGLDNVMMLPYQPQEKLPYSLTCGDISLVTQRRGMEGLSVPSKIYSSLAAGLAILAVTGPHSEIADIVERHNCGFRVSQGDAEGVVRAIEQLHRKPDLLADMKLKARECSEANYSRKMSIKRYVSVLQSVAGAIEDTGRTVAPGT